MSPRFQLKGVAIEAVIFDKDGTLADSRLFLYDLAILRAKACAEAFAREYPDRWNALYEALKMDFGVTAYGLDPDGLMAVGTRQANQQVAIERWSQIGGSLEQAKGLIPQIFAQVDGAIVSKAAQTPPFPETLAMMTQLSSSSLRLGILSSDSTAHVNDFLRHHRLDACVDAWRGTDGDDKPKPHPELFWQLCDGLQVQAAKTLMVGDSWADLAVAHNAGAAAFISVAEAWGRTSVPGSDYVIQDWNHLLHLIGLNSAN